MVDSNTSLNQVIAIDTLLSLDGVIPSLSGYQARLIAIVEQLTQALIHEKTPAQESRELCQTLCCYIDKHTEQCLKKSFLTWQLYSLENYFYQQGTEVKTLSRRLEPLLQSQDETIRICAIRLLFLLPTVEKSSHLESLLLLHTVPTPVPDITDNPRVDTEYFIHKITEKTTTSALYGDVTIFVGLLCAIWICFHHYLENLYRCLL